MNTKKWVQCVVTLVVVLTAMWVPVAVQAAPVQDGGEESSTHWLPLDWFAGLSQIWDSVRAALGLQTEPEKPQPPTVSPASPWGQETSTQEQVVGETEKLPTLDPTG